jgi:hypothetical protein
VEEDEEDAEGEKAGVAGEDAGISDGTWIE